MPGGGHSGPSPRTERRSSPRVLKFGGSCLRDGRSFSRAADLVERTPGWGKLVVVSAPQGTTDAILRLVHEAGSEVDPAEEAHLLSLGERLSARFLCSVLRGRGVAATTLEPEDLFWPLVTTGGPRGGRVDLTRTKERLDQGLRERLRRETVVMCGFLGVEDGGTSTLARGGSDTTAVVLARLLGSREVVLYKDVPGVLEVDPMLVAGASVVPRLSLQDARELAHGGSRIIAPEALEHLEEGMRIRVVPFWDTRTKERGTLIHGASLPAPSERPHTASVTAILRAPEEGIDAVSYLFHAGGWNSIWISHRSLTIYLPEQKVDAFVRRLRESGAFRAMSARRCDARTSSPMVLEGPLVNRRGRTPLPG